jgi:hypothetical protein
LDELPHLVGWQAELDGKGKNSQRKERYNNQIHSMG